MRRRPSWSLRTPCTDREGEHGEHISRIGWSVWCPLTRKRFHSHILIPPVVFRWLSADLETYICQAEALGPLLAMWSMPELFRGRRALFFIDNTAALSAMVHGTASKPDMSRIANAFHLVCTALRCSVWFEFVKSEANIADLPSRLLYDGPVGYFAMVGLSEWVDSWFPPFDTLYHLLEAFWYAM